MAARSRRLLLAAVLARMAGAQCPGSCRSNCTPAPHCGFDCCNHSGTGKHACVRGTSDSRGSGGAGHSGHGHSRTVWRDGLIDCSHTRVAQAVSPAVRHFARVTNATRTGSSYHGYWRKREAWFVKQVPRENGTVVLDLGAGAMHLRTALSQAGPPMDHDLPRWHRHPMTHSARHSGAFRPPYALSQRSPRQQLTYIPVDGIARDRASIVCDFNRGEIPLRVRPTPTVIVMQASIRLMHV